jgi:hypothetical protein
MRASNRHDAHAAAPPILIPVHDGGDVTEGALVLIARYQQDRFKLAHSALRMTVAARGTQIATNAKPQRFVQIRRSGPAL